METEKAIKMYEELLELDKNKRKLSKEILWLRANFWTNYLYSRYKWAVPKEEMDKLDKLIKDREKCIQGKRDLLKKYNITKSWLHWRISQLKEKWIITN